MELSPRELALKAAQILSEKKASDIEILEIGDLTVLAEYFVICTGTSSTQVRSLAEAVSYTHLDVYKRQPGGRARAQRRPSSRRRAPRCA